MFLYLVKPPFSPLTATGVTTEYGRLFPLYRYEAPVRRLDVARTAQSPSVSMRGPNRYNRQQRKCAKTFDCTNFLKPRRCFLPLVVPSLRSPCKDGSQTLHNATLSPPAEAPPIQMNSRCWSPIVKEGPRHQRRPRSQVVQFLQAPVIYDSTTIINFHIYRICDKLIPNKYTLDLQRFQHKTRKNHNAHNTVEDTVKAHVQVKLNFIR